MTRSRPTWLHLSAMVLLTLSIVSTALSLLMWQVEPMFLALFLGLVALGCGMADAYQRDDAINAVTETLVQPVRCPGAHCGASLVSPLDLLPWEPFDVCPTCYDAELVAIRDRMLVIEARDSRGAA